MKYVSLPSDDSAEDMLAQLALDLSLTANHASSAIWSRLNPELWEQTRNPWAVLQTISGRSLQAIMSEPGFRAALNDVVNARSAEDAVPRWFHQKYPNSKLTAVAYFSMEYMLTEALPIYSGGLGNVAGDQIKAANDLGVPVTGVGLLYSQGYFRQELDRNGAQVALYPFNDPGQLPIRPVRNGNGDWLRFTIPFPACELWIRAWEAQVGRCRLLLLDTNDPANFPEYRYITAELYGGGPELRLRQEYVLGIGGCRLLRALGIRPDVCHLNEGHPAFAVLERAAAFMDDTRQSFGVALTATRAGNLFTTHTPVEAGFDRFSADLMRAYFERYCARRLGIAFDQLMALGRRDARDDGEPFNMAYLAMRGGGAANGVSRLHGFVSRALFQPLFPRWPVEEVPIDHVTNGVHVATWESTEAQGLWARACGNGCWHGDLDQLDANIRDAADASIWNLRTASRRSMIEYIRTRYSRQIAMQGRSDDEIAAAGQVFDFGTLTLGFARRFATYKRPNLLLHDRERLLRILRSRQYPVQLVIAGKAHPQDDAGQAMIREWTEFIQRSGVAASVIFISDYDMLLTQELVSGVDVWINTPRRPWEASGTSGMKVLVNGGLNLSELDGWWAEAYRPDVGWAIGDGREHSEPEWDAIEADALYTILEQEVIPEFYERDGAGIPTKWVACIRESMARLAPTYSANRAVREYTEKHYIPAANAYAARAAQQGKLATEILAWQRKLESDWNGVAFGPLGVKSAGSRLQFEITAHFGQLDANAVRVELFAQGPLRITMDRGPQVSSNSFLFTASVEANRSPNDFTPRVVPYNPNASVPLEANLILWQK